VPKPLTKWSGSKRKLLPTYLPHFQPAQTFTDLFAGSFIVSQHATSLYPRVVANDKNGEWVKAVVALQDNPEEVVKFYDFWATCFVDNPSPRKFYNYTLRYTYHFGGKSVYERAALLILMLQSNFGGMFLHRDIFGGNYGTSYGTRRKEYPTQTLFDFAKDIRDVEISAKDWKQVPFEGFVFADPPYRSTYEVPNNYGEDINHEELAEALKAHGSFAYCGTDLGDGWLDEHFAGYERVEINHTHTSRRGKEKDKVVEVMVYA
jgi:site-specific DNA-adenine methylase